MTSKKKVKIFLSHSTKDKDFVESLAAKLAKDDYSVWYDDWEIKVGDSIVQKINDGISYSDFLIVVLSENSVSSKWVKEELNAATIKNIESKGAFILPVLLEKCKIPLLLADKKYADFTKSFGKAYNDLDDAIRHHLTLISKSLNDGVETDISKPTLDSLGVEPSIEENWLNLLEDANEIRIKRFLTRVKADIKSCFFEIVELDGVDTSDSIIHKYYQTIDTISILILTLVKYDLKQYRKELIDILNYTYNLIACPDQRYTDDNPRGKQAKLWLSIITRVYLIGAVALKLSKYDIIKSLILVEPGWSDSWRTYYWSRHCLIMHARSQRGTTSKEGLVVLSNAAIREVSWAEDYFEIASKEALENLASFDLYQNITVCDHGSLEACYPSYAQFHNRHLWKTFQDIGLKRNSYSIISEIPDRKVAKILLELDDYAGKKFSYATGWRTRSFPSELQKFIQIGLEEL